MNAKREYIPFVKFYLLSLKSRPTLETMHADPRSGTANFAASVASVATAKWFRTV